MSRALQFAFVASIDSTQAELLRRPALPQPVWLQAAVQTAGVGRQGRPWQAIPGHALTASLGMDAAQPWQQLGQVPLAVAVAVAEVLTGAGIDVHIKWPNDLYHRPHPGAAWGKAGGVLCQAVRRDAQHRLVVGIGLNWLAPAGGWPAPVAPAPYAPAAARAVALLARPDPVLQQALTRQLAHHVCQRVLQVVAPADADAGLPSWSSQWPQHALLHPGSAVQVWRAGACWRGTVQALEDDGTLRVLPDGATQPLRLCDGEVRLRLADPAAPAGPQPPHAAPGGDTMEQGRYGQGHSSA